MAATRREYRLGSGLFSSGINSLSDWYDKGLRVVSATQPIDFGGAVGKLLAAVLLGIAEMEQESRRERQAAGIAVARKASKYCGGKRSHRKPLMRIMKVGKRTGEPG